MRANLDLNNRSNTSFGMAMLKPKDGKVFGQYFSMDKLRFRRGVQQIYNEQKGFEYTNLRFNESDRSVSVLVKDEEAKKFPGVAKSLDTWLIENARGGFATLKAVSTSLFDFVFRPKRLVKMHLYEAGEYAKQIEKEHAADLAKQAKKAAIAAKREARQVEAVEKMFSNSNNK